jgi:hypothetical protein
VPAPLVEAKAKEMEAVRFAAAGEAGDG